MHKAKPWRGFKRNQSIRKRIKVIEKRRILKEDMKPIASFHNNTKNATTMSQVDHFTQF